MAVEKALVWTFPTNPKRLGRWYGKGPADRSPVGPGPAAARRVSSAMVPVRRSAGRGTWKRTASCERKTDRSATRRTVPSVSGTHAGSRTRRRLSEGCQRRFSRSRTVRCARERGGRPDPTSLDPACHPVLVSMVRGKGFPRRAPAGSRTRRRHKGENKDGTDGGLGASGKGKDLGAPVGPCGGSWGRSAARARGQVRRITPGNPWCRPGPSPRVGGTRSAGPRRRPRRARPARPRRCSRRSRRAARGRHHPTTGRTGWHRR